MKKHRSLGNNLLLLTTPLVATLSLGISSGNAAMMAGSGIEASTEEIIYRRNEFGISAHKYMSEDHIFLMKDLLNPANNQSPITSYTDYTDGVQPTEINPIPASEDHVVKAPSQNNTAKAPKTTSRESAEPLTSKARLKMAQLPKSVSIDQEAKAMFDPLPIIGGALALGFLFWMLLQD